MNWAPNRWAFLLTSVVVLALVVIFVRIDTSQAYVKTSWEYKVIYTDGQKSPQGMDDPERGLNRQGMDGWELVNFIHTDGMPDLHGTWVFKRPK